MTTATPRVAELKAALNDKLKFINEGIDKGVKVDGNNVEVKADDFAAMQKAYTDAEQIKSLIVMEQFGPEMKAWMDAPSGASAAAAAAAAGLITEHQKDALQSVGSAFVDSQEFKDMKAGGRVNSNPMELKVMDVSGYGQKDITTGMTGSATGARQFGSIQFDPMVPRPQRAFRVRDLFPAVATSANLIDYFRVLGYVNSANTAQKGDFSKAASVPERTGTGASAVFGRKPKSNLAFESKQAPVRTLAHWEAAHRNVLDDEPQLRGTIDNELLYGLRLEEDRQILNGSGENDELLGILNTEGIQNYQQTGTENKADALRRAATRAIVANYQPSGYVLNPYDWEDIELLKGQGDGQYLLFTNVAIGAQTQVWRQPVVETVAMQEGKFLTGAFGLGAQLYDRMLANVRVSENHEDFFVRNAIVILVEERLALAVKRPESFVKGSFVAGDVDGDGDVDTP